MGVQLGDIVPKKSLDLGHLSGRTIAIDAFNALYQFLSIIRQPDGTPLMDSKGRVTSHLSGLFYRTAKLMELGVKPVYVFDGNPPELKGRTIRERVEVRKEAKLKWEEKKKEGDVEASRKYAMASSRLNQAMIDDSKRLLQAMGIPVVQAPSEGEAQAAYMSRKGDVWAAASQDFDALLFGAPYLIRNMTVTGKRKLPGKNIYVNVEPELIELDSSLASLGIKREQLVDIGILIGTDFNEGIKGIGPKKALNAVKEGKTAADVYNEQGVEPEVDLRTLRDLFLKPPVTDKYSMERSGPDEGAIARILVDEHDFSPERIKNTFNAMTKRAGESESQSRLDTWFR